MPDSVEAVAQGEDVADFWDRVSVSCEGRRRQAGQIDDDLLSERTTDVPLDGIEDILSEPSVDNGLRAGLFTPRVSLWTSESDADEGRTSMRSSVSSGRHTGRCTSRYSDQQLERASFKRLSSLPSNSGHLSRCTQDRQSLSWHSERSEAEPVVAGAASLLNYLRSEGARYEGDADPLGVLSELPTHMTSRYQPGRDAFIMSKYTIPITPNRIPGRSSKNFRSLASIASSSAAGPGDSFVNQQSTDDVSTDAGSAVLGGVSPLSTLQSLDDRGSDVSWPSVNGIDEALTQSIACADSVLSDNDCQESLATELQEPVLIPAPPSAPKTNRPHRRQQADMEGEEL